MSEGSENGGLRVRRGRLVGALSIVVVATAIVALCVTATSPGRIKSSSTTDQTVGMPKSPLDLRALPLGSGDATTGPQRDGLFICHPRQGGPPVSTPPWVDLGADTWNAKEKVAVQGKVKWDSQFKAKRGGAFQLLTSNRLPRLSGTFPVSQSDPAYAYNPNPGSVVSAAVSAKLTYDPQRLATPECVDGVVGIMADGIAMLDAFDAGGLDAGAVEVQDICHGHPNDGAGYHYHSLSPCLLNAKSRKRTTQVGWALDGYGIYVEYDDRGRLLTNDDLDACHGRTGRVPWHGEKTRIYHYVLTHEFPYSVSCFRAAPAAEADVTGVGYRRQ